MLTRRCVADPSQTATAPCVSLSADMDISDQSNARHAVREGEGSVIEVSKTFWKAGHKNRNPGSVDVEHGTPRAPCKLYVPPPSISTGHTESDVWVARPSNEVSNPGGPVRKQLQHSNQCIAGPAGSRERRWGEIQMAIHFALELVALQTIIPTVVVQNIRDIIVQGSETILATERMLLYDCFFNEVAVVTNPKPQQPAYPHSGTVLGVRNAAHNVGNPTWGPEQSRWLHGRDNAGVSASRPVHRVEPTEKEM